MIILLITFGLALTGFGLVYVILRDHEEQKARTRIRASGYPSTKVGK